MVNGEAEAYKRANTDWLAACRYGVSPHWTAQTMPRKGPPLPFQQAVDAFDVPAYLDAVAATGADYLIFGATHALQMPPAPNPVIDRILPGRTCERDLLGEIADGLAERGLHLILYYNHSCNSRDDPEWERAVGYHDSDLNRFADNICAIVESMGRRYGPRVKAWWFDSSYSVDPSGPHNSITTDMTNFQFPWERLTRAAKAAFPERLVTYNAGVGESYLYTTHQDYWAGEMTDLDSPPASRFLANGLQWHGWTCLDDRNWVQDKPNSKDPDPLYPTEQVVAFVRACIAHSAPMTFNVATYQDGAMGAPALLQLQSVKAALEKPAQ